MFVWLPLIINGIVTLLYMAFQWVAISGIISKKPRIILAWLILAAIQCFLEIVYFIVESHTNWIYPKPNGLVLSFILKPLSLLATLIVTGLYYRSIKNDDEAGEAVPILHTGKNLRHPTVAN